MARVPQQATAPATAGDQTAVPPDDVRATAALARCPYCKTCFKVPEKIWNAPDSRVRCGECLDVFDVHLEAQEIAATATATLPGVAFGDDSAELPSGFIPPSAVESDAARPETATIDENYDSELDYTLADFDLYTDDDMLSDDEPVPADPGSAAPVLATPLTLPDSASLSTVAKPRSPAPLWRSRRVKQLLLPVCSVSLIAGMAVLVHFSSQPVVYNSPVLRPLASIACSMAGCGVPARVAMDELILLKRNVYSHPSEPDVLVIDASFENRAAFAQRYPILGVRLSDNGGHLVADQDFEPAEYLDDWHPDATLLPQKPLDILLEVNDPGHAAETFELIFKPS